MNWKQNRTSPSSTMVSVSFQSTKFLSSVYMKHLSLKTSTKKMKLKNRAHCNDLIDAEEDFNRYTARDHPTLATDDNRHGTDAPLQDYSSNTSLFPDSEMVKTNHLLVVPNKKSSLSNRVIYILLAILICLVVILIIAVTLNFVRTPESDECTFIYGCDLDVNQEL